MKLRCILLITCLLWGAENAFSQSRNQYKPKDVEGTVIGFRAGGTASWINLNENSFDYPAEYETYPGVMGGLIINIAQSDTFFIQPEILFVQKGYHATGLYRDSTGSPIADSYLKFRSNYLEIPVLFKLALGKPTRKFFVNAGPYLSYWINGNVEGRHTVAFDSAYTITTTTPIDANQPTDNRTEIGGVIGAGAEFVTRGGTFLIELRYTNAFSDRLKYSGDRPEGLDKIRNKYFSLSVGYLLRN